MSTIKTTDGIEWYYERQGHGPDLLLIPSGEGDCGNFGQVAENLASAFRVTTFDMPGFSRSKAPEAAIENLTVEKVASQIIRLMDELEIQTASIYGCSSGGLFALGLAADYPDRVRNAIVHEVPLTAELGEQFEGLDDADIVKKCTEIFENSIIEDLDAWRALGKEYHARLERNYVTWIRSYMGITKRQFAKEDLIRRPVDWTVGALTQMGVFFQNVPLACEAGVPISLLPCKHFPQVTIPDMLTEHIRSTAMKYL